MEVVIQDIHECPYLQVAIDRVHVALKGTGSQHL